MGECVENKMHTGMNLDRKETVNLRISVPPNYM